MSASSSSKPLVLTTDEEVEVARKARRIALGVEAHRRARTLLLSTEVRSDRFQEFDDFVEFGLDSITADSGLLGKVRRCADLLNEVVELLAFHENSPSVAGSDAVTSDADKSTVGDATDVRSPLGTSVAPSGGDAA